MSGPVPHDKERCLPTRSCADREPARLARAPFPMRMDERDRANGTACFRPPDRSESSRQTGMYVPPMPAPSRPEEEELRWQNSAPAIESDAPAIGNQCATEYTLRPSARSVAAVQYETDANITRRRNGAHDTRLRIREAGIPQFPEAAGRRWHKSNIRADVGGDEDGYRTHVRPHFTLG